MSEANNKTEPEKRKFIGHAVRTDPNIDKEDMKPIEKRKKPRISINWTP